MPYCGFGVYPLRYSNLSNKQKLLAAENKKKQTRENLLKYVEILKPKFVIPFAGEVILAGKIAKSFHKFSGIGSKTDAIKYVKKYYKNQEDERDLIIHHFSKLISMKSRVKAIYEAMEKKFETIILDDGFQDYKIKKNVSILCFNEKQLIGNGLIFPSGPLRENLNSVKDADIILINGKRNIKFEKKILGIKSGLEVFYSNYKLINFEKYENKKLFLSQEAEIPENFFSLKTIT